ncbi:DUF29 domain-containing protein [Methylolobus aquaticus]
MSAQLHDQDFYSWTHQQAELLRQGRLDELDTEHLIEELDSMGARERRELETRLSILLQHLLRWRYQPERRGVSWLRTIKIQRFDALRVLEDNPGLRHRLPELFASAYSRARILATDETAIDEANFPEQPPFVIDEALNAEFLPE